MSAPPVATLEESADLAQTEADSQRRSDQAELAALGMPASVQAALVEESRRSAYQARSKLLGEFARTFLAGRPTREKKALSAEGTATSASASSSEVLIANPLRAAIAEEKVVRNRKRDRANDDE